MQSMSENDSMMDENLLLDAAREARMKGYEGDPCGHKKVF